MNYAELGGMGFLQQAHRNNWQQYLASLKKGARDGWDVCVLTASDARQAGMYRRQLDWRRESGLLPTATRFLVVPDPEGRRLGSGGATLRVLRMLAALAGASGADGDAGLTEDLLSGKRVLVIHSGGSSQRLPHCSAIGKLFARVPRSLPDGRASTIFDEFLIGLSGLATGGPPGVLVASGDVLLIFDHLQLTLQRGGVAGVAASAPADMGRRHGVYVTEDGGPRLRAYLHKPSAGELARWGAIDAAGMVQIDTGLIWWDMGSAQKLVHLAGDRRVLSGPTDPPVQLNLYGDLLLALAESTTFEAYLGDTSDGPATPAIQAARSVLWEGLRGTPLSIERLQPAVFVHFGTSHEYWRMAADDARLAWLCGWTDQAASWLGGDPGGLPRASWPQPPRLVDENHAGRAAGQPGRRDARLVLASAAVEGPLKCGGTPGLVLDSRLGGALALDGPGIIAGVQSDQPIWLPPEGSVLYQTPLLDGTFATQVLGLRDDPKLAWDDARATFMGRPWTVWLAEAGMPADALWPETPAPDRTLWNALLYPVARDREQSLSLALPLQDPARAPFWWRSQWLAAPRICLAVSAGSADGERILSDQAEIEDYAAVRRFTAAVNLEAPAVAAARLLGAKPGAVMRRSGLAAARLAAAPPLVSMRGYKALAEATGNEAWEDRAFAILAGMIHSVAAQHRPSPYAGEASRKPAIVRAAAPARIDFGGGWTDTPPYGIERGGTVLNAAIAFRGKRPIICEARPLPESRLVLESRDLDRRLEPVLAGEVLAYDNPADPFALAKAAVVLRGIVPAGADPAMPVTDCLRSFGSGLHLSTSTTIPRGSGLGASSIMAGVVLAALGRLMGIESSDPGLFDEVLRLEQMLTTGGGWQDQVGGLTGGIKLVTTQPGLPQRIVVAPLDLASHAEDELARRLVLLYTGQQRLAKNLLRAVMARWIGRELAMVWILEQIAQLALGMHAALLAGDLDGFGSLLAEHWALNKRMDPGCSNPFIDELFDAMAPHISGGKLAGAGGGGFALVVARNAEAAEGLPSLLAKRFPGAPLAVWPCTIPEEGLSFEIS